MLEALMGIALAVFIIWSGRFQKNENWLYSASAISLPLLYAGFAVYAGNVTDVRLELLYGLPYIALGVACLFFDIKASGYILAALWALHGVYDMSHEQLFINEGIPDWYPLFCAVLDWVVAIYIAVLASKLPSANIRLAGRT